ncbi:MAG: hypothetical protein J0H79_14140 [Alphaproteobacteria bacterium]|nr:hypothetical protein [Alphaproteobacteria bacterium]
MMTADRPRDEDAANTSGRTALDEAIEKLRQTREKMRKRPRGKLAPRNPYWLEKD